MSADILERLDFMLISRRSDEDAIIRDARAEIVRLREDNLRQANAMYADGMASELMDIAPAEAKGDAPERCKECRRTTFERRHDGSHICVHCKSIATQPAEAKDPAPAMPNGVDAARVLADFAETAPGRLPGRVQEAIATIRAADNRDAAGVTDERGRPMTYWGGTPAPVPAGEAVATVCAAARARFGPAAHPHAVADWIEEQFRATPPAAQVQQVDERGRPMTYWGGTPAPVQAAPQEGEGAAERLYIAHTQAHPRAGRVPPWRELAEWERAPWIKAANHSACELGAVREVIDRRKAEAEKRSRAGDGYTMGWSDGVAGFARELEAALQHRGDSQEVGRG